MDPLLIEQLACYLSDLSDWDKDKLAAAIVEFLEKQGVPHKDALTTKLQSYETVDRGDDWNPMDAAGGNFDDAYWMGVRDGEAQLAAELRGLLGIQEA